MSVDLRLGDCLEGMRALADSSVDVCVTDPPYEAEAHTKQRRQLGKTRVAGGNEKFRAVHESPLDFVPITADQRVMAAKQIARVTKHCAVVFCQVEAVAHWRDVFNDAGMPYRRCMLWSKPDAMPSLHGRWPGQSFEAMVLAVHRGARPCPIGGKAVEYRFVRASHGNGVPGGPNGTAAPHPTTKPLPLMLALVEHFTRVGDLVLDPFAGSGTTGVACKQLGRSFLGFEISPEYFAIAQRRLAGESARIHETQLDLLGGLAARTGTP